MNMKQWKNASPFLFSFLSFPLFLSLFYFKNKTTSDVLHFLVRGLFSLSNKSLNQMGSFLDVVLNDFSMMIENGFKEIGGYRK
ncbi:hypothetical protein A7Q09_07725 [Methylacidiphilum sp. Yel]|uniref:hypothetical protein n=1 Tax=Methylacidiphilum sp. Yel TaxID=1847730 RepID=UPI00106C841D|nr:hypothetical protein [Methylacidiphilum sp. Yel]TFE67987.1 hypothetical protein A7Q09_07725 [Methylacidiphilum sp. Yel]